MAKNNVYDRKKYRTTFETNPIGSMFVSSILHELIFDDCYTGSSAMIAEARKNVLDNKIPYDADVWISSGYGWDGDEEIIYFEYDLIESDADYNRRIAAYELRKNIAKLTPEEKARLALEKEIAKAEKKLTKMKKDLEGIK